jgi:hypothetical protein
MTWGLIMTIITGKMVKISPYHFDKQSDNNTFFNICSDKYIKINLTNNVSKSAKIKIIQEFISHLSKDENFTNPVNQAKFPIFNGSEIIGTSNYYSVIEDSLKEYSKTLKQ